MAVTGRTMLAFSALLILGGLAIWKSLRPSEQPPTSRSDAERLLDERLARGDIDQDDYTQRRNLLHPGH